MLLRAPLSNDRQFHATFRLAGHSGLFVICVLAGGCCGDVPEMDSTYVDAFKEAQCGNGTVDEWEECDDGDANSENGPCSNECIRVGCGDGLIDEGEECDDGDLNIAGDYGPGCSLECRVLPWCGDGVRQPDYEACDDGDLDNSNACLTTCEAASCGDGYLHTGAEQCDYAITNDCTNECTLPGCGNNVVEGDEECDDGNADETDECTSMCTSPRCGDGHVQVSNDEECDDGNEVDDDGCNNDCARDRVVFVTSEIYSGYELGGLVGADAICQSFATDAELDNADSFLAWLSDDSASPATRFLQSKGAYRLLDGRLVAWDWDDLTDGEIWTTIDVTDQSEMIDGSHAWSNTGPDGFQAANPADCSGWKQDGTEGRRGSFQQIDERWTDMPLPSQCASELHLYCFEQ